ncbi:MAG TPA: hypothetical protein VGA62_11070 [Acidimicrobiia bacterium]
MAKVRAVLVATCAAAMLALAAPGAHAAVPAANTKFCKAVTNITSDISGRPNAARAKVYLAALKNAGKYAPGNVRSALNTLADYYNALVKAGTDTGKIAALTKLGSKYAKAATTFATYYVKQCAGANITIPTTG